MQHSLRPKIPLYLVNADGSLVRAVRIADPGREFSIVRFRHLERAFDRVSGWGSQSAGRRSGVSVLLQCAVPDVNQLLGSNFHSLWRRDVPMICFCPELPQLSLSLGQKIQLALLEWGARAVFSEGRKLPQMLALFRKHAQSEQTCTHRVQLVQ